MLCNLCRHHACRVAPGRPGLLIAVNFETIVKGYLWQPVVLILRSDRVAMVLNVFANAIPSQLVPGFDLLYRYHPLTRLAHTAFATNPFDAWIVVIAVVISAAAVAGGWIERGRLRAEILYVLAPIIVLVAVLPSTARYFLPYSRSSGYSCLPGSRRPRPA